MRNLFSILFIVLILLNVLGYYGLFIGLQYRNDRKMIKKLDAELYNSSEAITIKIPLTVPYASDSRDFQRIDGKFEYNGEAYRLVKQRLSLDTLYVICVKDSEHQRIDQALAGYVKTFSDKPSDQHSSGSKLFQSFIKDYLPDVFDIHVSSLGWSTDVKENSLHVSFIPSFCTSIIHPPERV